MGDFFSKAAENAKAGHDSIVAGALGKTEDATPKPSKTPTRTATKKPSQSRAKSATKKPSLPTVALNIRFPEDVHSQLSDLAYASRRSGNKQSINDLVIKYVRSGLAKE